MFLALRKFRSRRGMTLLDVLIGIALYVLVFLGLFAGIRLSISVIATNKAKTGALALATEQMELIRSIPYDSLGTVGGIPNGTLAQSATTTLNATEYTIRTLIIYVDLPADGEGGSDDNGITADAKEAKVEVSWEDRGDSRSIALVSTVAPKGLESVAGGGTLRINVFDASASPIASAQVRVVNNALVPVVDVTTFTNASGVVLFPGAAAGASYEVTVTKSGYSTSKTYDADAGNPNPNPGHLTVALGLTTTSSFFIDTLGSLVIKTWSPVEDDSFDDTFADADNLLDLTNTVVAGGAVELDDDGAGGYLFSGTARATTTEPAYLASWDSASWNSFTDASTTLVVRVMGVDGSGIATEIPDVVLPGNSGGFTISPVSLDTISTTTYPRLSLEATFSTIDASTTPTLLDWHLAYQKGPTPLPNIPFAIHGAKTIGTTGASAPIYKYDSTSSTDAAGAKTLSNMEWDAYTLSVDPSSTGLNVMESCAPQPVSLAPGEALSVDMTLTPETTNSLLVDVRTLSDALLEGVAVTISRTGFSTTATSTACGQAFFGGLSAATYDVSAVLSGYSEATTTTAVSGVTTDSLILEP